MLIPRNLPAIMTVIFGFATSAMAADLPKEGTFNGTYTAIGTYKATKIGDRVLNIFDENGVQVTNGFGDHFTFHCWGTNEIANGDSTSQGYCVGTDPTGDLVEVKFAWDRHATGEMAPKGPATYVAGTGKFAGISGDIALVGHSGEFRPPVEGTYVSYVTFAGNYKLP